MSDLIDLSAWEVIKMSLRALSLSSLIFWTFLRDWDLGDEALGPLTICILGVFNMFSGSMSESILESQDG
jgi:hypothetical protein